MASIYDDVALLQQDVEALQGQVRTLQTQLVTAQNNITNLNELVEDTGWINLEVDSTVEIYNESLRPKYRRIGNEVFLSGVIKGIDAANAILGRLPEGFRPTRQHYFVAGSATISSGEATFYNCQVNADGNIRITAHSTGTYSSAYYLRLNSSYLID